jgi:hypothetical protein
MVIKALNDTIGLNSIVLTLLVFRAYLQILQDLPPLPDIV